MKKIVFLSPIFLFFIFLSVKILAPDAYKWSIDEDSLVEYAQVVFYFLAAAFSFVISKDFLRHKFFVHGILYGILAIGLLFVFFEEISWGQRIIGIDNPAYFSNHNLQDELTIHNLDVFDRKLYNAYILIGLYGAIGWLFVPRKIEPTNIASFVVPEWYVSSYFFFVFAIYTFISYVRPFAVGLGADELRFGVFLLWRDQEPAELFLAVGFLIFVAANFVKLKRIISVEPQH